MHLITSQGFLQWGAWMQSLMDPDRKQRKVRRARLQPCGLCAMPDSGPCCDRQSDERFKARLKRLDIHYERRAKGKGRQVRHCAFRPGRSPASDFESLSLDASELNCMHSRDQDSTTSADEDNCVICGRLDKGGWSHTEMYQNRSVMSVMIAHTICSINCLRK